MPKCFPVFLKAKLCINLCLYWSYRADWPQRSNRSDWSNRIHWT